MRSVSVGLYFDTKGNVIIDPEIQVPAGFRKASCKFIRLQNGYTGDELADAIMNALETSLIGEQEDWKKNYWTEATGIKGYAAFSKKHKCVSVSYILEKEGYNITAQKRYPDGSYGVDSDNYSMRVKEYPGKPVKETIADQVLEALRLVEKLSIYKIFSI